MAFGAWPGRLLAGSGVKRPRYRGKWGGGEAGSGNGKVVVAFSQYRLSERRLRSRPPRPTRMAADAYKHEDMSANGFSSGGVSPSLLLETIGHGQARA